MTTRSLLLSAAGGDAGRAAVSPPLPLLPLSTLRSSSTFGSRSPRRRPAGGGDGCDRDRRVGQSTNRIEPFDGKPRRAGRGSRRTPKRRHQRHRAHPVAGLESPVSRRPESAYWAVLSERQPGAQQSGSALPAVCQERRPRRAVRMTVDLRRTRRPPGIRCRASRGSAPEGSRRSRTSLRTSWCPTDPSYAPRGWDASVESRDTARGDGLRRSQRLAGVARETLAMGFGNELLRLLRRRAGLADRAFFSWAFKAAARDRERRRDDGRQRRPARRRRPSTSRDRPGRGDLGIAATPKPRRTSRRRPVDRPVGRRRGAGRRHRSAPARSSERSAATTSTGVSWIWIWFGVWADWVISAIFVAPKLRRFGALTVADYVGKRFASEGARAHWRPR